MSGFSPGTAQACFDLLKLIGVQGLTGPALVEGLRRIGGFSSAQVLELSQTLNWISIDETGLLVLSAPGTRLVELGAYEAMLAQALLDYAELVSPPWLQNATSGRSRVMNFAEIGVKQLIVEAGLAEGADERVVVFWDTLAALARGRRDDRLTAIGRDGERQSIAYETARTGRAPRWVAIDSNEDGFDLLSIVGVSDTAPLAIEVKASVSGMRGDAHISRGEWEMAVSGIAHVFHFWDLPRDAPARLAVLAAPDVEPHVPLNSGCGKWESVMVPFNAFAERFEEVVGVIA